MSDKPMTHREILEALTGLLLAMFVAMLSSTIVSNALPTIVTELEGSQTGYTWVVVATLLAMTASTPLWGKLSDLYSKKRLVQTALVIFTIGSVFAGLAQNMDQLITARVIQGLGVGGLTALVQVVIAAMVPPRDRGKYSGYIGAVFASATIIGPLIGGAIVDSFLGWRWCFFLGVPVAFVAFIVLAKTLHLPAFERVTRFRDIDWAGATLITAGVSTLLVWVSLGGHQFDWASGASVAVLSLAFLLIIGAILVEHHQKENAIIPLFLFKDRTVALATAASLLVGVALFGATVYLSQYFQLAKGMSPTHAGLMSIPTVLGLMVSSTISGRIISKTGYWKKWLVGGMATVILGLVLLGTIDEQTHLYVIGAFQVILGVGLGSVMQNLVLAVQNTSRPENLGATSSLVAFFRSMGGSAGVAAMGAVLSHHVATKMSEGLTKLGIKPEGGGDTKVPDISSLPAPIRDLYEHAFGTGVAEVFLIAVPFAVVSLILVLFLEEIPLRTTLAGPEPVKDDAPAEA